MIPVGPDGGSKHNRIQTGTEHFRNEKPLRRVRSTVPDYSLSHSSIFPGAYQHIISALLVKVGQFSLSKRTRQAEMSSLHVSRLG